MKERVAARIGPFREPGKVKAGRIQGGENGSGVAQAKHKSAKPATGAPVKASGCNRESFPRRSI